MNVLTTPRPKPGPPDPDLDRLATDLRLVVGRLARRLRQQGDIGITASLLSAMWTIERLQPVTLGELSAAERVQPPTVTRFVSKLEASGLVTREIDPSDRRVARVRLTPQGARLLDQSRSRRTAYLHTRLRALDPAERKALGRAVSILDRILEEGR